MQISNRFIFTTQELRKMEDFNNLIKKKNLTDEDIQLILNTVKEDKYLTVKEVANITGYSLEHVYRLIGKTLKEGGIPSIKMGHYRRIKSDDLEMWLENQREEELSGNYKKTS